MHKQLKSNIDSNVQQSEVGKASKKGGSTTPVSNSQTNLSSGGQNGRQTTDQSKSNSYTFATIFGESDSKEISKIEEDDIEDASQQSVLEENLYSDY